MRDRSPPRLPELKGPAYALFLGLWLLVLPIAIAAPLGGAWLRVARDGSAMNLARAGIDLLPPLFLVVTAVLLFLRRRRDMVAALLSLSFLAMTGAFFAAEAFFREIGFGFVRDLLAHGGRCLLILVLLTFPNRRFVPRWAFAVALLLLVWGPFALLGPVALSAEYLGYLLLTALSVFALTVRYRRLSPGRQRQQISWVLFGFAAGTLLLVLAFGFTFVRAAVAPDPGLKLWADVAAQLLAALGVVSYALGLIVSLLRYRLYDADALISRSAVYASMTLLLGAIFAGTVNAIEKIVETSLGRDAGAIAAAVAAAVAALVVTPAYSRINRWAERRFQPALSNLRGELPPCLDDLRETEGMEDLLDEVLGRIVTGVRALRAAILLAEDENGPVLAAASGVERGDAEAWRQGWRPAGEGLALDCDRSDPLFPLRIRLDADRRRGRGTVGWILLGPRPDGSFYGKDEQEALAEIASPIARAIQIVKTRERREAEARAEAGELKARIARLEEKLGEGPS